MNLREKYLPWKYVIANIILDKNTGIRTVVNKVDEIMTEYRTFPMEVLAGDNDMDVQVSSLDCVFKFNFEKVYWNSRLESEHRRLVKQFKPGEAVCDVMAGVGPFAIPAGKKGNVVVWANDLNPDSYESLKLNIKANKVRRKVPESPADF